MDEQYSNDKQSPKTMRPQALTPTLYQRGREAGIEARFRTLE